MVNGSSGEWDENLDIIGSVILYDDTYMMWYSGGSDGRPDCVGLATSEDGIAWTRDANNPVFEVGPEGSWDQDRVTCGDVTMVDDTYHMWYTGGNFSLEVFGIGHAFSTDGINWERDPDNPVLTVELEGDWEYEWIWVDEVVFNGSEFHMWYQAGNYPGSDNEVKAIGHATSPDGSIWTRDLGNPVLEPGYSGEWDYPRTSFPSVVFDGTSFHMWYAGGETPDAHIYDMGYATSTDGSDWDKYAGNPVMVKGPSDWDSKSIWAPTVIDNSGIKYQMWYRGDSEDGGAFGYAESDVIPGGTDKLEADQFSIYPNPTNGLVNIKRFEPGECVVEIASLNGQIIYGGEMKETIHQLDLSSFEKGVYLITIRSVYFVTTRKIIKL